MSQKTVHHAELGEVVLAKRKGTKHIRISINGSGKLRVSVPYWLPYEAGLHFALTKKAWILKQRGKTKQPILNHFDRVGKAHHLEFVRVANIPKARTRIVGSSIIVTHSDPLESAQVQKAARTAAERALKKQAEQLLPLRLEQLANQSNHTYRSVQIKKLTSRWGSCSSNKDITLSFFLMKLPWELIDYVLLHELAHTVHMHHQAAFWQHLEQYLPNAKQLRNAIKQQQPAI